LSGDDSCAAPITWSNPDAPEIKARRKACAKKLGRRGAGARNCRRSGCKASARNYVRKAVRVLERKQAGEDAAVTLAVFRQKAELAMPYGKAAGKLGVGREEFPSTRFLRFLEERRKQEAERLAAEREAEKTTKGGKKAAKKSGAKSGRKPPDPPATPVCGDDELPF
jgi:hypothetical protein